MAQAEPLTLALDGLSCGGCAARAGRAIAAVTGVVDSNVNLATHSAALSLERPDILPDVVAALADAGYPARQSEISMPVSDLSCASCVARLERALAAVPGVISVRVNLANETAFVTYAEGALAPSDFAADLAKAAKDAGYPAAPPQEVGHSRDVEADKENAARSLLQTTRLAAMLTLPVFVLEMGSHMIPAFHHVIMQSIGMQTSWLIQWLLTTLVLFGPGRAFYTKGAAALWRGVPDMNSLVAVGTGAAYGYSLVATFAPNVLPVDVRAVYFEAAAVIVVLILLGRWLEARAKGRTGAAIASLMGLQPRTARVQVGDRIEERPVSSLAVGDVFVLRPGERVPTDGIVQRGESHVDEAMLTGEPLPVFKTPGALITGGTVNTSGPLTVEARAVGKATVLAQIIGMVEAAQSAKLPIQSLVDRITLWFVPAVMALALATVLAWLLFGPDPALTFALVAGVSVLIIACPCAMGLATPTSIMVGTGRAAELGVLFAKGAALQRLEGVRSIAFDKTGTLTEGRPTLDDIACAEGASEDTVLQLVASAESASEHPLARAIEHAAQARGLTVTVPETSEVLAGQGLRASVAGQVVLVGTVAFLEAADIDISAVDIEADRALAARGMTVFYAAIDGQYAARFGVTDPVKEGAAEAIAALQTRGLDVAMISGDARATADHVAARLGITQVFAEQRPDSKVAALEQLAQQGPVAFVGDGLNDAPVLAKADIGIAIGTGTDVAIEAADVVLMAGDVRGVVTAFDVSQRTLANIRQNLMWAFGYNVALLPVAAGVLYPVTGLLLSPMLAAAAMGLSSVFVVSNALRLRHMSGDAGIAPKPRSDSALKSRAAASVGPR